MLSITPFSMFLFSSFSLFPFSSFLSFPFFFFFLVNKSFKGLILTCYPNYSQSLTAGACGLSHSVVCNLTGERVMKFLECNSQLKKVQASGRSVLILKSVCQE